MDGVAGVESVTGREGVGIRREKGVFEEELKGLVSKGLVPLHHVCQQFFVYINAQEGSGGGGGVVEVLEELGECVALDAE